MSTPDPKKFVQHGRARRQARAPIGSARSAERAAAYRQFEHELAANSGEHPKLTRCPSSTEAPLLSKRVGPRRASEVLSKGNHPQ